MKALIARLIFLGSLIVGTTSAQQITTEHQTKIPDLAAWTILVYIQADNSLASIDLKNMKSMEQAKIDSRIGLFVQRHHEKNKQITRYNISSNTTTEISSHEIKSTDSIENLVVDAMKWAITTRPAQRYMLVFWDHGTGIIDRKKIFGSQIFSPEWYGWLEVPGRQTGFERGILYSDSSKTYMTNQQLSQSLARISQILGKKIDIVGMDACLMAMLEIGYQIKDYADFLVASQNSEPGIGWHYQGFLSALAQSRKALLPHELAEKIVTTFDDFYRHKKITFHTQSALDLSLINDITQSLDKTVLHIMKAPADYEKKIRSALLQAKTKALKFDYHDFCDIHSFLGHSTKKIQALIKDLSLSQASTKRYLQNLLSLFRHSKTTIEQTVIYNSAGNMYKKAKGLSIYMPIKFIHPSYPKTSFARNSYWLPFLHEVMNAKLTHQRNACHTAGSNTFNI